MARYSFVKPETWKIIKPEKYRNFSILSTELVPCIYGFGIQRKDGGYDVVSMYDYGESSGEFISAMDEELTKLEKNSKAVGNVNEYIRENAADYVVSETQSLKPILHKAAKIYNKNIYISIMEVLTNVGKSYSIQIFVKLDKNLVCFGTSVAELDVSRPMESALESSNVVSDLVNKVIKTLEKAKE